jgi:hypothetical protein
MEKKEEPKIKDISIIKNIKSLESFFKSEYKIPCLDFKVRIKCEEIMKKKYPNYSSLSLTKKL